MRRKGDCDSSSLFVRKDMRHELILQEERIMGGGGRGEEMAVTPVPDVASTSCVCVTLSSSSVISSSASFLALVSREE